jgi:hypothetical protein
VLGNKFYNYNGLGLGQGQLGQYTQGQLTGGEVATPEVGNYQQMQSAPMLPNYLGIPFRILVSPFINFNPETRETDVLVFNSKNPALSSCRKIRTFAVGKTGSTT